MRKFLIAALLMLVPVSAMAGWNIKQNADGSTVWIDSNGNTLPVAGPGALFATITNLSDAATILLVNIRPGKIKAVYGIAHDASSLNGTAPAVTVFKQTTENTNGFEPLSTAGTTSATTVPAASALHHLASSASGFDVTVCDFIAASGSAGRTRRYSPCNAFR